MRTLVLSVLATASLSHAIQLPFDIGNIWPLRASPSEPSPVVETQQPPRIAIIGAGAGGSSAAFWIAKAKERSGLNVEIDIYERSDYIGGRKSPLMQVLPIFVLSFLQEALRYTRIIIRHMNPWNLGLPFLWA
jgi:heterodisulfide reductase subunit A-like polyferredoxin